MRHFQQLAAGVNVTPLMNALQRQPELWDANPIRTQHPGTAHSQVSDILVFFNSLDQLAEGIVNDKEVIPFQAWDKLPQLRDMVFDLMRTVGGIQLGRVIITRLPPGKTITPHVDQGAPAEWFSRYQIALQSLPGAMFHIGEESVNFRSGDVWMIDNRTVHSVENFSKDDRIVCIVDIRCA